MDQIESIKVLIIPADVKAHKAYTDWKQFHISNRDVMRTIIDQLSTAKANGVQKTSVKMIINWMRWNMTVKNKEQDFKINDKYTGIYTHVIQHNFPEYRDMIDSRELRCKPKVF